MNKGNGKPTRGNGLLEGLLAKKRAKIANQLIPSGLRLGRLLDVGCGTYPYFLENTLFKEKTGVDKVIDSNYESFFPQISLVNYDFEHGGVLPFDDNFFDVVTMLAVIEHIELSRINSLIGECHRVISKKGRFIITTPVWWTDKLLRGMAVLRLVSPEEILEHKDIYSHSKIALLLQKGGFSKEKMKFGYFELYMNLWVTATK